MFRFKQFTVHQDRTAMKVCTDACVLGAWADVDGQRLLDIGTGTGLLALMAAQRNPTACIDAVEMDAAACGQARENVAASPFSERIKVIQERIQAFSLAEAAQYDRVLINPPFYTNHLRSPDDALNRALHNDELPFDELVAAITRLLHPAGQAWLLLPPAEWDRFRLPAEAAGLRPFRQLSLRHHPGKPVFRTITGLSYVSSRAPDGAELSVYEPDGRTYTADFRRLLSPFYLIF